MQLAGTASGGEAALRFGEIGFAIPAVAQLPEPEWTPLPAPEKRKPDGGGKPVLVEADSPVEAIAEVSFVSNEDGYRKSDGIPRNIAVRRALPDVLGVNDDELPQVDGKPACAIGC